MADETPEATTEEETGGSMMYYVIGALVVVAIAAGVWFLRPKATTGPAGFGSPLVPTPTPGPISALACEKQYYNPLFNLPGYYLGLDGVDVPSAKSVTCAFTVSIGGAITASESANGELTAAPERSGQLFTCRTKKLELTPDVATDVSVEIKDDVKGTTSCTQTFTFPRP
jgi:hypothetical protein